MKHNLFLFFCVAFSYEFCYSQTPSNYSIVFEKKINVANLYPKWDIGKRGKFYIDSSILMTNSIQSTYTRIENPNSVEGHFSTHMMFSNTFIDIKSKTQVSQKEIADGTFILTDSLPKLKWKILPETRKIVGFDCYKAMTNFQDTVVVVAYFTTQLQAPIGPECIGGLPGTILGMVVPKLHTTWLAKSFRNMDVTPIQELIKPNKGKPVNLNSLIKIIKDAFKEYDNWELIVIRALM